MKLCTVVGRIAAVRHHVTQRIRYVGIGTGLHLWQAWMEWIIAGVLEEKLDTLRMTSLAEIINMLIKLVGSH